MDKAIWLLVSFVLGLVVIGALALLGDSMVEDAVLELEGWFETTNVTGEDE